MAENAHSNSTTCVAARLLRQADAKGYLPQRQGAMPRQQNPSLSRSRVRNVAKASNLLFACHTISAFRKSMSDPLSVAASIIGIIAAAGKVAETLGPFVSNVKDTKNIARTIQNQAKDSRSILQALQRLFDDLEQSPRRRRELIQIDQLRATLLDGAVIFSDLEPVVLQLGPAHESLRNRVQWVRKKDQLETFISRLELFKSSITVMLNILQWYVGCPPRPC